MTTWKKHTLSRPRETILRKKLGFKLQLNIISQDRLDQDPAWLTSGDVWPTNKQTMVRDAFHTL